MATGRRDHPAHLSGGARVGIGSCRKEQSSVGWRASSTACRSGRATTCSTGGPVFSQTHIPDLGDSETGRRPGSDPRAPSTRDEPRPRPRSSCWCCRHRPTAGRRQARSPPGRSPGPRAARWVEAADSQSARQSVVHPSLVFKAPSSRCHRSPEIVHTVVVRLVGTRRGRGRYPSN